MWAGIWASMGGFGMTKFPDSPLMNKSLQVVRLVGTPWKATLFDGTEVFRRRDDIIEIPFNEEPTHRVKVAPYDNHFIYVTPSHIQGWGMMCTCGNVAVIVGYNQYRKDASPSMGDGLVPGELVVCYSHASSGKHSDGAS